MRTISFYSFKGGVGRTSLVLNLAYELAARAKFVVLADWDLHAPGLSLIEDLSMPGGPFPRKGVLDFLSSAIEPLNHPPTAPIDVIDPSLLAQPTLLAKRARPSRPSFGDIFFIPAGHFAPESETTYPSVLRDLKLPDLLNWRARLPGSDVEQSVLRFFRDRVAAVRSPMFGPDYAPDYLLLDSRTGITEIGELLLGNSADHYVILFGLNEQNQAGMELTVRGAQRVVAPGFLPEALSLVVSPVPVGEEDLLRDRLAVLNERLSRLSRPVAEGAKRETMPRVLQIPYHPRLALREEIIIERYPESSLAQTYRQIASHVLGEDRIERQQAAIRDEVLSEVRSEVLAEVPVSESGKDRRIDFRWISRHRDTSPPDRRFVPPPPWNWPKPALTANELLPRIAEPQAASLLSGLAWSRSLGSREKRQVLAFAQLLPAPRLARLIQPFDAERQNWESAWQHEWQQIERNQARAAVDWVQLLGQIQNIDVVAVWRAVANGELLPPDFATTRFLFRVARELDEHKQSAATAPLLRHVLVNPVFGVVSKRIEHILASLRERETRMISAQEEILTDDQRDALESILELRDEAPHTLRRALSQLRTIGWKDEAIQLISKADALRDIQDGEQLLALAYECLALDQHQQAEHILRTSLRADPDTSQTWTVLAMAIGRDANRRGEADSALQKAKALASNSADWRRIAVAYAEHLHDYVSALEAYENSMAVSELSITHELELAEIAIEGKELGRAREALDRAAILAAGPNMSRGFSATGSISGIRLALEIAFSLRVGDRAATDRFLTEVKPTVSRFGREEWNFTEVILSLRDLPEPSHRLMSAVAKYVTNTTDAKELEESIALWKRAVGSTL